MTVVRPVGERIAPVAELDSSPAPATPGGLFAVILALLSSEPAAGQSRQQDTSDLSGQSVPVEAPAKPGEESRKRRSLDPLLLAWALANGSLSPPDQRLGLPDVAAGLAPAQRASELIEVRGASSATPPTPLRSGATESTSGLPLRRDAPVQEAAALAMSGRLESERSLTAPTKVNQHLDLVRQLAPEAESTLPRGELAQPPNSDGRLHLNSPARTVWSVTGSTSLAGIRQIQGPQLAPTVMRAPGSERVPTEGPEVISETVVSLRIPQQEWSHVSGVERAARQVAERPRSPEHTGQGLQLASGSGGVTSGGLSRVDNAEGSLLGTHRSEPQQVVAQLVQPIHVSLRRGLTELLVRLEPPSLGLVEVRLAESDGMLRVMLASADPVVRELLRSGSEELRRDLAVHGFRVERVLVTGPTVAEELGAHLGTAGEQEGAWGRQSGRQSGWTVPVLGPSQPAVQPHRDAGVSGKRLRGDPESRIEVWA